tara:strand:- start:111 stop:668 length:558 start_codon:yes stop_codon:yes gene_type:complete
VPAVESNAKAADPAKAQIDKDNVGQLMAQHVEIEKNRLKEPSEKPAQIEDEAYGEVEKRITAPELEPERSSVAILSRKVKVRVEYCDSGNEAERQKSHSGQNAKCSRRPAELGLIIMRLGDSRFYRGESAPAPRALVGPVSSSSICFPECFPERGMVRFQVFGCPSEMELFSASCHAGDEIIDIL